MTCTRCGSARLALALAPGETEPTCAVCLGCGALQDRVEPRAATASGSPPGEAPG